MIALAGATVAGLAACDPVNGLNSASIAVTTDRTGTRALEHEGVDVQWLNCTARAGGGAKSGSSTASTSRVADVDCNGRTKGGKDISLSGKVDREVEGRCVSGDMTAKTAGKTVFRATMLGNCDAAQTTSTPKPPAAGGGGGARPTVTVTVTVTAQPQGK
ncbi:hypothetical protein ACFVW8_13430 [Streptomyces sp. NPDC058221]|uniref:hypothetical protein n=1 Tax=Streptomyces sp. NPDC058221 TaxID=3346388 RepID=UPI0036EA7247